MKKITIQNFGPIQNIEDLEIKDFMVFIGPQASGKSTLAKAVYFFKTIREEMLKHLLGLLEKKTKGLGLLEANNLSISLGKKFIDLFGNQILTKNSTLDYEFKPEHSISINGARSLLGPVVLGSKMHAGIQGLTIKCQKFVDRKERASNGFPTQTERIIKEAELEAFKEELINEVNQLFGEEGESLFIPAGRAVLTSLMEQLPFFEEGNKLDVLIRNFAKQVLSVRPYFDNKNGVLAYENAAKMRKEINSEFVNAAKQKAQTILRGEYRRENDEERIYFSSDQFVNLGQASSGQQESLWILMLMFIRILDKSKIFMVIEEPEAHLFPEAQKEMVELIALCCNAQPENKALITTHSPYILTALNNLLYAYEIGKNDPQGTEKVINKPFWLDPARVAAYYVENGRLESIMSDGLIQAERIDEISNKINNQLDQLYDLQSI